VKSLEKRLSNRNLQVAYGTAIADANLNDRGHQTANEEVFEPVGSQMFAAL
jgi:hypothetical protein